MSATTTNKPVKTEPKETWLSRFKGALEALDTAKAEVENRVAEFGTKGLAVGYLLVEKYGNEIAKDDREKVIDTISTVGRKANDPRTNLDGKPYSWSTVGNWHKAARIEAALKDARPELAEKFSVDGLAKIASVETRKDLDEAVSFAVSLVEGNKTSNRAVRGAFEEMFPKPTKTEKSPSDIAVAAKAELKDCEKAAQRQLNKLNLAPNAINHVLQFAALVGMTTKDAEASVIVLREMLKAPEMKAAAK